MKDDKQDYEDDVYYEIWRRGGNPDAVRPDDVDDYYYNDYSIGEAASAVLERQRRSRDDYDESF